MAGSAERMRKKRARDREKGLVQASVTVPAERLEDLRRIAEMWEGEHRVKVARARMIEAGQQDLLAALDAEHEAEPKPVTGAAKQKRSRQGNKAASGDNQEKPQRRQRTSDARKREEADPAPSEQGRG